MAVGNAHSMCPVVVMVVSACPVPPPYTLQNTGVRGREEGWAVLGVGGEKCLTTAVQSARK